MPTLAQSTGYGDLTSYSPVETVQKTDSGLNMGSYSIPQPQYPNTNNQYLRATVPQIGNSSADSQRVYFAGGTLPQTRVPILQQLGSPF
jgi:hypothetical protein